MSLAPSSSFQEDDEINLAVVFQGLKVSVVGPASKPLDFIHKLDLDYQVRPSSSQKSSAQWCLLALIGFWPSPPASQQQAPSAPRKVSFGLGLVKFALGPCWIPSQFHLNQWYQSTCHPSTLWCSKERALRSPRRSGALWASNAPCRGPWAPRGGWARVPSETEARAYLAAAGYGGYGYLAGV